MKSRAFFPTSGHQYDRHINARVAWYTRRPRYPQCAHTSIRSFSAASSSGVHTRLSLTFIPASSIFHILGRSVLLLLISSVATQFNSCAEDTVSVSIRNGAMLLAAANQYSYVYLVRISAKTLLDAPMCPMQNSNVNEWMAHLCIFETTCLGEFGSSAKEVNTNRRFLWSVNTCTGCCLHDK